MNKHNHDEHTTNIKRYSFNDFLPFIIIGSIISIITITHQWYYGWHMHDAMRIFMASFFLIFGSFKIINLPRFVQAYAQYDLLTKRWKWYGYLYPFLELGLGFAYLFSWNLYTINILTLTIMVISAAGVFNELRKGRIIPCACLGDVFRLPMTYVTLAEDLLMATMALIMLFM